jgi:metal-responsive CopG/Arc/MetJ family transcriptional regulator
MLTVRLDDETRRKLDELASLTGRSRSEIVREAIRCYSPGSIVDQRSVLERLKDVVGVASIGGTRARDSERILRTTFMRKRGR